MSTFEEMLIKAAQNQLKSNVPAVPDTTWLDSLISKIKISVQNLDVDPDFKTSTLQVVDKVVANKSNLYGLGPQAFALYMQQLASGKEASAVQTYVQAYGNADQIIADMEQGTMGLIAAKKRLDQWYENAWEVTKSIAITGARLLLPFALALL